MDRKNWVAQGNIVSTQWTGENSVGCYLGNGRFGAIMSGLGLNLSPEQQKDPKYSPSHFNHMRHWGRFRFFSRHTQEESSSDYILPLYKLYWAEEFTGITDYRQCHDLYDGVLYTDFRCAPAAGIHVTTWFDSVNRDLAGVIIHVEDSNAPANTIHLSVPTPVDPCSFVCGEKYTQSVMTEKVGEEWRLTVTCDKASNHSSTPLYISTDMETELRDTELVFHVKPGNNSLLMSVHASAAGESPVGSLVRTVQWWHNAWQEIGWIQYPDAQMQKTFIRAMAYLMSSYDADCEMIQPANSMGIGGFAYNFVPDMENVAPALLMMGRQDIVKHWVELFAGEIDGCRRYAKRLWPDAEGIFPPWELNFGPIDGHHFPKAPIIFCYEAHNAGYLCKLAMDAVEFVNDPVWAKAYAYPLIQGCAEFFRTFCYKKADGLWHLRWYPCMGREEASGINKEDYLCTLITAQYSFQTAIQCGLDEGCDYRQILSEGLAFESLLSERGILHTCRGDDNFGKQKHPIQLESIVNFPIHAAPLPVESAAYQLRHEITSGANIPTHAEPLPAEAEAHQLCHEITAEADIPKFYGWTLAEFLIADSNMKDYRQWLFDWNLIGPSHNVDENWVQFYESCGIIRSPFYLVTHGMVMQSLIRNCVNDFWGRLEIGTCLPKDISVQFRNIRTRLGVSVSGTIEKGRFQGCITAQRDCDVLVGEQTLSLKRGESKELELSIG